MIFGNLCAPAEISRQVGLRWIFAGDKAIVRGWLIAPLAVTQGNSKFSRQMIPVNPGSHSLVSRSLKMSSIDFSTCAGIGNGVFASGAALSIGLAFLSAIGVLPAPDLSADLMSVEVAAASGDDAKMGDSLFSEFEIDNPGWLAAVLTWLASPESSAGLLKFALIQLVIACPCVDPR